MSPACFGKFTPVCIGLTVLLSAITLLGGCHRAGEPRMRFGSFFGSPRKMDFPKPDHLGTHCFESGVNEINGMVYTCKGGFIDMGHVREAADRTAYLRKITYQNLISKNAAFSFYVIEPSRYWINVSYPLNWDDRPAQEKEVTANEVSILLGQYLAHTSMIWHEILTGYGFSTAGLFPDTISSFSWEDCYSDLMGTSLAAQALRNESLEYDDAMTRLINQTLKELDVQPTQVANRAAKAVEGQWYTGGFYFFVMMKKRNFDIGLDDCRITPLLVPGICSDTVGRSYPVPSLEELGRYGFKVQVEIESLVWENNRIHDSIGLDRHSRIEPQVHFGPMIEQLENRQNKAIGSEVARQKTRIQNAQQFGKL
jgi:hypothetical protein